jgi:carbonic anhydrase/acetyltransferase-like protein (isoleucine patch superfamily)
MALILPVGDKIPQIGKNCYLAPNCTIVGDVIIEDYCSIWFNVVIRGDVNSIRIGRQSNIQDGAVIHCTYKQSKTIIGEKASIGHNAIVHGATLEDEVLIGMGSIVMDHSIVGKNSIIAAGSVVLEHTMVEKGAIYGGIPAKKLKDVDQKRADVFERTANNYVKYASWFDPNIKSLD